MAEFAYNNAMNASTHYTPFELNCGYNPRVSYQEDLDPHSKLKIAKKLSSELQSLMAVCQQYFHHAQLLLKQTQNKGVKPQSYVPGKKM